MKTTIFAHRSRTYLTAGLCGVAALALVPQMRAATAAHQEDLVTTGWVGILFLVAAAAAAILKNRWLSGGIIVVTIVAMNYLAANKVELTPPPVLLFDARTVIWGVTPPLLLALWQLSRAQSRTSKATWATAALWVGGFAIKFLHSRDWHV